MEPGLDGSTVCGEGIINVNVHVSIDGKQLTAHVLDGIRSELLLSPATVGF